MSKRPFVNSLREAQEKLNAAIGDPQKREKLDAIVLELLPYAEQSEVKITPESWKLLQSFRMKPRTKTVESASEVLMREVIYSVLNGFELYLEANWDRLAKANQQSLMRLVAKAELI